MQRRQFLVVVSFAMTINKSQGQSLEQVGLFLSKSVFIHSQLYVALSRVRTTDGLKIYLPSDIGIQSATTLNVVYKEIFRNIQGWNGFKTCVLPHSILNRLYYYWTFIAEVCQFRHLFE